MYCAFTTAIHRIANQRVPCITLELRPCLGCCPLKRVSRLVRHPPIDYRHLHTRRRVILQVHNGMRAPALFAVSH